MKDYSKLLIPTQGLDTNLSKIEVNEYLQWFLDLMPNRIRWLSNTVNGDSQNTTWVGDFSRPALLDLGKWFSAKIFSRNLSPQEKSINDSYLGKFNGILQSPSETLSSFSMSLVIDIGIYLGKSIMMNVPDSHWKIITKPERYIYKNKPVLIREQSTAHCCPIHLVYIYALGLMGKKVTSDRLADLYDLWSSELIQGE